MIIGASHFLISVPWNNVNKTPDEGIRLSDDCWFTKRYTDQCSYVNYLIFILKFIYLMRQPVGPIEFVTPAVVMPVPV